MKSLQKKKHPCKGTLKKKKEEEGKLPACVRANEGFLNIRV